MSDLRDRLSIHVSVSAEASETETEAFYEALCAWVGMWMEDHPDRGQWDPFVYAHTESCDDSDHCHGPGSVVEREILARHGVQS